MEDKLEKINEFENKLKELQINQARFSKRLESLKKEFFELKPQEIKSEKKEKSTEDFFSSRTIKKQPKARLKSKSEFERIIGESLASKVGILLTIIGVILGVKYSIEHELISPIIRICSAYICSGVLIFFSHRLKKKYINYSAILLSGAMSIAYFTSFAAYSFYSFISQLPAFILMLLITSYTVAQAISYKKEIIALIGMVGAYAIPFLIGTQSDNYTLLLSYIAIINIGILFICFFNQWKIMTFLSFGFTWSIFLFWFWDISSSPTEFSLALFFSIVFFITFQSLALSYKLIKKEKTNAGEVILLLANTFLFYGTSYALFSQNNIGFLGLLTFSHALFHGLTVLLIYKINKTEQQLFYFFAGLALVFGTMSIPIQFDGNWVTILWCFEALLLFAIGRKVDQYYFESLAYPIIILSFCSLLQDWNQFYTEVGLPILANKFFLGSLIAMISYGSLVVVNSMYPHLKNNPISWHPGINRGLAILFLITLFFSFYHEMNYYWKEAYRQSTQAQYVLHMTQTILPGNQDIIRFNKLWLVNYSLTFMTVIGFINSYVLKHQPLARVLSFISPFLLLIFCAAGLNAINELKDSYLSPKYPNLYSYTSFLIAVRYISLTFPIFLIISNYNSLKRNLIPSNWRMYFNIAMHFFIIWILSSELKYLLELNGIYNSTKIGLSILWSIYSLTLILIGIIWSKQYLRIMAISLFAITLIKLFFYDLSHLDILRKTIVFIVLGILLLITSYFYNRNKERLFGKNQ